MESKYDNDAAKKVLKDYIEKFLEAKESQTNDHLSDFKSEKYRVESFENHTLYKLAISGMNSSEVEEATFIVHGIILDKDFPPVDVSRQVRRDRQGQQKFAEYIRQSVALTGLNLDLFENTLRGLAKVHQFFRDSLPGNKFEPLHFASMDGFAALGSHTRYFTSRRNCYSPIVQNFGPGVDPSGELEKLKGNNFVHTVDNIVQYLGEKRSDSGTSYYDLNPVRFQKGDIVEISISFFCTQTRSGKYKMISSLKTIVLLDDTIREKARSDEVRDQFNTKLTKMHLKRRLVTTDSDESLTSKCARMDMS